jgi:putative serine protease PepD
MEEKGTQMPRNKLLAAIGVAALAGGGAGAGAVAIAHSGGSHSAAPATTTVIEQSTGRTNVANGTLTVGEIAKADTKSVVEIDATSASSSPYPNGSNGNESAEGTGFIYDAKGDIVTNAHVVDGATSLKVKFSDGSTYTAKLVGEDASTDVAVVHIGAPASKLVPLAFADSSTVEVGDGVVAIGNPYGLDGTVTSGIVSAVNREITSPNETPIAGALQTDAAINHGNSGGPLLNLQGEVIGITSQIQSSSGVNDGIGFAVPSNTVRTIADELISSGKAEHALLGINPSDATNGVKVATVESGSAADSAGIKVGDVITAVDGKSVTATELRALIAADQPGDTLTLTIERNGSTKTIKATLGSRSS